MFLFFSLLAASIDGYISGFAIAGMGVKFNFKDFFKVFFIIFLCCICTSFAGGNFAVTNAERYINIIGVTIMLFLAVKSLKINPESPPLNVVTASFSVAADASIVCMYLAADGYNIFLISTVSAAMHSVLMYSGAKTSHILTKEVRQRRTAYISAAIFTAMALFKIAEI